MNKKQSLSSLLLDLMSFGGNNLIPLNDIECVKFCAENLKTLGCKNDLQIFGDTANLLSTIGQGKKHLCFLGHCDVVPVNDQWTKNPCGEIVGGKIYGRGAVDMLGGNACWMIALDEVIKENKDILNKIQISTFLTGAEENDGSNGAIKMSHYLKNKNIHFDACVVGEPTSRFDNISEMDNEKLYNICCGRQGSLGFFITICGKSGHVGDKTTYDNPIFKASKLCNALYQLQWNNDTHLEIVSFDADNPATNVVLDEVKLFGDVRYYDMQMEEVSNAVQNVCHGVLIDNFDLKLVDDRRGYKTDDNDKFLQLVYRCMKEYNPNATFAKCLACSDGEYMVDISDSVLELGLKTPMCHKVDEYTTMQDLNDLKDIYKQIIIEFSKQY